MSDINFKTFIKKILRQLYTNKQISKDAVEYINKIINNFASSLSKNSSTDKILNVKNIEIGLKTILIGQLLQQSIIEGNNTVKTVKDKIDNYRMYYPVSKMKDILKLYNNRIGKDSSIFLAGVLDYLTAEIIEVSGLFAEDNKKKRIEAIHVESAILKDEELIKILLGRC
jgi:histone H3/H4